MTIASNLGFPPMGAARELKRATEGYWSSKVSLEQLLAAGAELRRRHWQLERGQRFRMASAKPANEYREAKAIGLDATTVLIGPLTFLLLAKTKGAAFDRLSLLDQLLPVYGDVLESLAAAGATWVQLDEPCLALDRSDAERDAYRRAYKFLASRAGKLRLLVATYFAGLDDNLSTALA